MGTSKPFLLLEKSKEDKVKQEGEEAEAETGDDAKMEDGEYLALELFKPSRQCLCADLGIADAHETTTKVSTSGPRGARREEWRKSKGMGKRESRVKSGVNGGSRSFKPKRRR